MYKTLVVSGINAASEGCLCYVCMLYSFLRVCQHGMAKKEASKHALSAQVVGNFFNEQLRRRPRGSSSLIKEEVGKKLLLCLPEYVFYHTVTFFFFFLAWG